VADDGGRRPANTTTRTTGSSCSSSAGVGVWRGRRHEHGRDYHQLPAQSRVSIIVIIVVVVVTSKPLLPVSQLQPTRGFSSSLTTVLFCSVL